MGSSCRGPECGRWTSQYEGALGVRSRCKVNARTGRIVQKSIGSAGVMLFVEFNHGMVICKETGHDGSRILRFVIGNPLIMKEMAKHVPDAGSYAPVTILVDERSDGVHLSYDRMASFLKPYGNTEALQVARDLDAKVEALLASAAG